MPTFSPSLPPPTSHQPLPAAARGTKVTLPGRAAARGVSVYTCFSNPISIQPISIDFRPNRPPSLVLALTSLPQTHHPTNPPLNPPPHPGLRRRKPLSSHKNHLHDFPPLVDYYIYQPRRPPSTPKSSLSSLIYTYKNNFFFHLPVTTCTLLYTRSTTQQ